MAYILIISHAVKKCALFFGSYSVMFTFSILTPKCNLRDVRMTDDEQVLAAMSCPEVAAMHTGGFRDIPETRRYIEVLVREYEAGKFKTLAVADRQSDLLLGCVIIYPHQPFPRAELGYWMAAPHRNKGYMTEAVAAVIRYAIKELGVVRVQACHSVNNPASGRVMEKAGMRYEGTLRLYNGREDENMYAMVNTDVLPEC